MEPPCSMASSIVAVAAGRRKNKKGILSLICGVCFRVQTSDLTLTRMLSDFRLNHINRETFMI